MAIVCAQHGANIVVHYHSSKSDTFALQEEIYALGVNCWIIQADLNDNGATFHLLEKAAHFSHIDALINNASVFDAVGLMDSTIEEWETALRVNLTAPFLLTQAFARQYSGKTAGRVVNLVDWRALRPGKDHFPYTISKAGLVALTKSAALSLAPRILVNSVALGAILPPETEPINPDLLRFVPMKRWADIDEFLSAILFLLDGPEYITGEVIHLDGGRHLI